jgi:hypothetical protein
MKNRPSSSVVRHVAEVQGNGSPGSHPHADRRNWKPAETIDEYLQNCREGLEDYSQRKAAGLWGVSRSELQRWRLMADIPEPLFEALLSASRAPSTKSLGEVGRALRGTPGKADIECCPQCGFRLRVRPRVSAEYVRIVAHWLSQQGGPQA